MSTPRLALRLTSAWRELFPLFTVTARPGIGWNPLGELYVIEVPVHVAAATTGLASGGPATAFFTIRQRLSMWASLPAAPLTRQNAAMLCDPGPSGMTAVTARVS